MDGHGNRDGDDAPAGGFLVSGSTEGTVMGGSFAFTEPELRTIIRHWLDLAESYRQSQFNADRMTRVEGPGDEFASARHADAANRSGAAYRAYVEHNRVYCLQQAQLFQDALDEYLGVEHTNVADLDRTGSPGPRPRI